MFLCSTDMLGLLEIVQGSKAFKQESKVLASGCFILRNISASLSKRR